MKIEPITTKLTTYSGDVIIPIGAAEVQVQYGDQQYMLPLVITPNNGPTLLGRNWLYKIRLDWVSLFNKQPIVNSVKLDENLESLLNKNAEVFAPELGTPKDMKVRIPLNPDAKPKFFKARTVPYALKDKIEKELDRMVKSGVYEPVEYSSWATPIVPVPKPDGSIRVCGDYKLTVNQAAEVDSYPVPKAEDLLATLNGG